MTREPLVVPPTPSRDHVSDDFVCSLHQVSVSFAERDVLKGVDLHLGAQQRIAVLGDNGAGKSTLLRVLAGTLSPTSGHRLMQVPGGIAMASQNPMFAQKATTHDVIDGYHHRFRDLERLIEAIGARLERAEAEDSEHLLIQLSRVTELYESQQGYLVNQRLMVALEQLGLGSLDKGEEVATLSGGQRSRLALAAVLCAESQLLLLDEPTNDLDDTALAWLEDNLQNHRGAMVVVSHDRVFLHKFAQDILQIEQGKLRHYRDGYDGFLRAKRLEREQTIAKHQTWTAELERAHQLVVKNTNRVAAVPRKREKAGFGHGAFRQRSRTHGSTSRIRQAKSRIDELTEQPAIVPPQQLHFELPRSAAEYEEPREELIILEAISRRNVPKLSVDSLTIRAGERWLISGANGAGKTTLLRVLAGQLPVESGEMFHAPGLSVRWLRQDLQILPGDSLIEAYALAIDAYLPEAWLQLAASGLFEPQDFTRHPRTLSVGQQRRLELAVAISSEAEILLLDEPTSHLSPELVEQVESALTTYPGTVITVTHDRRWQQKLMKVSHAHRLTVGADAVVIRS